MNKIADITTVEKYAWGDNCLGWRLVQGEDLSVIQEEVPPGKSERRHYHKVGRQFFYILEGLATIEIEGQSMQLQAWQGISVEPGQAHQFKNDSRDPVKFLVITTPKLEGDRIDLD